MCETLELTMSSLLSTVHGVSGSPSQHKDALSAVETRHKEDINEFLFLVIYDKLNSTIQHSGLYFSCFDTLGIILK